MLKTLLAPEGLNRLVQGRHGYVLYNQFDSVVGRSVETYGEYFESEVAVFRQICALGDVVLDIGANIGTHTLALARIVGTGGRVIAFEPQRVLHQILCANMALNGILTVDTIHAAVGAQNGQLHLAEPRYDVPGNFGGVDLRAMPAGVHKVPLIRLDDYLEVERLRLIKIDVEGMETDVLRGATRTVSKFRPLIYVENDRVKRSEELITLLLDLGYQLYWHLPPFFNRENFTGSEENIHAVGFFMVDGELKCNGFAINMFCLPAEQNWKMSGFKPVLRPDEHPLNPADTSRFLAG